MSALKDQPGVGREETEEGTDEIVKLDCRDTTVYTVDDLLCDHDGVDMVHVKTITQSRDTRCDLVELDAFLASIW
jgi:hypothetical protein